MCRWFSIDWRIGRTRYRISVVNPEHRCGGVRAVDFDGAAVRPDAIPVLDDGRIHDVVVLLGEPVARSVPAPVDATTGTAI
jgi:hypothetical protein